MPANAPTSLVDVLNVAVSDAVSLCVLVKVLQFDFTAVQAIPLLRAPSQGILSGEGPAQAQADLVVSARRQGGRFCIQLRIGAMGGSQDLILITHECLECNCENVK